MGKRARLRSVVSGASQGIALINRAQQRLTASLDVLGPCLLVAFSRYAIRPEPVQHHGDKYPLLARL